jgi:hypothetical protein
LQELDRGIGQHMGMDVDGSRHFVAPRFSFPALPEMARRVVCIFGRGMQYSTPLSRKTVFLSGRFGYKGRPEIEMCLR